MYKRRLNYKAGVSLRLRREGSSGLLPFISRSTVDNLNWWRSFVPKPRQGTDRPSDKDEGAVSIKITGTPKAS
jgi:hypothetical protein